LTLNISEMAEDAAIVIMGGE